MANIFSSVRGAVSIVADAPGAPAFPATFVGPQGSATGNMVIQETNIRRQCNYQLLPTLRNYYYIYSFGELPSDVIIKGVALSATCNAINAGGTNGIAQTINFYGDYRLSKHLNSISISFGGASMTGFLVGMQAQSADPIRMLSQFALELKLPP